ncbi:MAG: HAMP domain-containing protein, partial [Actinomycetia bacterium]|nr:HAMP domain-containing protein [Actinomycetes bacterium]
MRRKKKLEEKHHQRNQAGRLQEITDALGKLASGDFSVRLETSPQRDELDALAVGVSILAGELGSMVGELKDVMNYT